MKTQAISATHAGHLLIRQPFEKLKQEFRQPINGNGEAIAQILFSC
jgi:hypothetical protein